MHSAGARRRMFRAPTRGRIRLVSRVWVPEVGGRHGENGLDNIASGNPILSLPVNLANTKPACQKHYSRAKTCRSYRTSEAPVLAGPFPHHCR